MIIITFLDKFYIADLELPYLSFSSPHIILYPELLLLLLLLSLLLLLILSLLLLLLLF